MPNESQLKEAFELWEVRWRDNPHSFLTTEECARMEVADISTQRAIYFGALLRELAVK